MPRTGDFRIQATNWLLTYPRCGADKADLLEHLKSKFPNYTYICVSREFHEDGGLHLHAFVKAKKDIQSSTYLDYQDIHGNYQAARQWQNALSYVKKDGDWCEDGTPPKQKRSYEELLSTTSREDFWALANEGFARDVVLNHEKLEYFAEKKFKSTTLPTYESTYNFNNLHPSIEEWKLQRHLVIYPKPFT